MQILVTIADDQAPALVAALRTWYEAIDPSILDGLDGEKLIAAAIHRHFELAFENDATRQAYREAEESIPARVEAVKAAVAVGRPDKPVAIERGR